MKEEQGRSNITVRWDIGLNKRPVANLVIPRVSDGYIRIMNGDEIRLIHSASTWDCVGTMKGFTAD